MEYKVYFDDVEMREVKEIFWSGAEATEKISLKSVITGYKNDAGFCFDNKDEAEAKVNELNAPEDEKRFSEAGDARRNYYLRSSEEDNVSSGAGLDKVEALKKMLGGLNRK